MIRIATRASALARWQAEYVGRALADLGGEPFELVTVETHADRRQDIQIAELGGKGVFVKEIQAALLDGRADVAVHSAKDLPAVTPAELVLACVPERADARDALVGAELATLARGATVATGSQRRRVQLAERRPDLSFVGLRGNIASRLTKIPDGGAIVMAAAALQRLELSPEIVDVLSVETMLPQVGQGALAVECRGADGGLIHRLGLLEHEPTRRAVDAERSFLAELGGDCDLPAGAHAVVTDDEIVMTGVLAPDGVPPAGRRPELERSTQRGVDPDSLGRSVARALIV